MRCTPSANIAIGAKINDISYTFNFCIHLKKDSFFFKKGVDFKSTNISRRYVTAVNRLTDTNKKSQAFRKLITSEIIKIINTIGAL